MAVDLLNIDEQLPWLRRQQQEQENLGPHVLQAMQFGAQLQQRKFDDQMRLLDFGVRKNAQDLQNQATTLRIQEAQKSLDDEEADHPLMAGFLDNLRGETDLDTLRSMGLPTFNSPRNLAVANSALSQRITQLSGITAERMKADTLAYNFKELDSLDPDLRQIIMPHLQQNGTFDEEGASTVLPFVQSEQQKRTAELKVQADMAHQEAMAKRQVQVATIRSNAVRGKVQTEPSVDQALMRHTGTVMRQENLSYSDAQDVIRAEWQATHAGDENAGGVEMPVSQKISEPDKERLKSFESEEGDIRKRIDKVDEALDLATDKSEIDRLDGRKLRLEQQREDVEAQRATILNKYTPKKAPPKAGQFPAAPPQAERQTNTVYLTPKGPYKWNGSGWETP